MKNRKKVLILTTLYFVAILSMIVTLFNAENFNVLDIESSSEIYIVISYMLIVSCFITPIVIVFAAVNFKNKN